MVVGSINMDVTLYLDRWPEVGETISAVSSAISLGGKGANQAIASARLGARVSMLGALGDDAFGAQATEELLDASIALQAERFPDTPTGIACIDVGPDGRNMIRLLPGANAELTDQIVQSQASLFGDCKVLLLQNEIPLRASLAAAEAARQAGAVVIMDPAPVPDPPWGTDTFAAFDIITPNLQEAQGLLGQGSNSSPEPEMAAVSLARLCARGAVVTMGDQGVVWCIDGQVGRIPAPSVDAIDTVAAGDCFNGALAVALARGKPVADAISFAVTAGALATTRRGASASLPTLDQVMAFQTSLTSS
ncbi:ribokinase [Sedimentitalea sp.]|uniref:ribokinase n=1 Tax=Sedimentitalea sp. TaxID=2048915 RepID=UPI0032974B78